MITHVHVKKIMCFYLEPSSGNISLTQLQTYAESRLDFLTKVQESGINARNHATLKEFIYKNTDVGKSECLIEGTKKDTISHYVLRLALCVEKDTAKFLIEAETLLFEFRFLCMTEDELHKFFKKLDSSLRALVKSTSTSLKRSLNFRWFEDITSIYQSLKGSNDSWRYVARKYLQGCDTEYFYIPFNFIFDLVAKRLVILQKGTACVPYSKVKEAMTELFTYHLLHGLEQARMQRQRIIQNDDRMKKLFQSLKVQLRRKYQPNSEYSHMITNISHDMIDSEVKLFPPCMFHLHKSLQLKHRLRHHSRIQYTLFLKEIGMSVHDSLMFWRKEYSTTSSNESGCMHAWKNNELRYIYNIRHLYGLEGSCINYRGHCCTSLQSITQSPGEDGGCPFKHFDESHLEDLLQANDAEDEANQIFALKSKGEFSEACQIYLQKQHKTLQPSRDSKVKNAASNMGSAFCDRSGQYRCKNSNDQSGLEHSDFNLFSGDEHITRNTVQQDSHSVCSDKGYISLLDIADNSNVPCQSDSDLSSIKHTFYEKAEFDEINGNTADEIKRRNEIDVDGQCMLNNDCNSENVYKYGSCTVQTNSTVNKHFSISHTEEEYFKSKKRKLETCNCGSESLEQKFDLNPGNQNIINSKDDRCSCKSRESDTGMLGSESRHHRLKTNDCNQDIKTCYFIVDKQCEEEFPEQNNPISENLSNFSCYDHELCPSQFCHSDSNRTQNSTMETKNLCTKPIIKPLDFYFSLKRLSNGLSLLK